MATGYAVEQGGKSTVAAGTSASTPVFAAIVGRLNAARLAAGKPVLGFLNPWLYQIKGKVRIHATAIRALGQNSTTMMHCTYENARRVTTVQGFTDITTGNNPGEGAKYEGCKEDRGFHATAGWDPATGWGTPAFKQLLMAALAAP